MKPVRALFLLLLVALAACGQAPAAVSVDQKMEPKNRSKPASNNLPFLKVQDIALGAVPGEVVRVDLEEEHGKDIYEFKILAASGRVIELEIDAATGKILKQEAD
jgi:uncharacterized membrane protein YkoI